MWNRWFDSWVRQGLPAVILAAILVSPSVSSEPQSPPAAPDTKPRPVVAPDATANQVRTALESELAGDNQERGALLAEAMKESPDNAAVRWQLGYVRERDAWITPAEAERAARKDTRLAEYRRLRDKAGPTVAEQTELANWCRKNKLVDEERAHRLYVRQAQSGQVASSSGNGASLHQLDKVIAQWRPLVTRWRRAIAGDDAPLPDDVREKILSSADVREMLALQKAMWQQVGVKREQRRAYRAMALELIKTLAQNPRPAASQALTWLAVFSDHDDVRQAATAALKSRPMDHYVPVLLAGLESPIEAASQYTVDAAGNLIAQYDVNQESPLGGVALSQTVAPTAVSDPSLIKTMPAEADALGLQRKNAARYDAWRQKYPNALAAWKNYEEERRSAWRRSETVNAAIRHQQNVLRSREQATRDAAALRASVDARNAIIKETNARIAAVLRQTTEKSFGDDPVSWWIWWWRDHNEYASSKGRGSGVSGSATDRSYASEPSREPYQPAVKIERTLTYGATQPPAVWYRPSSPVGYTLHSCFAPGTKVWTLLGRMAIEQIKVGDRVLAQNVETGELTYKPVLGVTLRGPSPRVKIGLGSETVVATPGHPFWTVGEGWQMSKELDAGTRLHTLSGAQGVESVEKVASDPSPDGFSYNLIVADFNTYFVGDRGILAHDNTPRKPTAALLPGLVREATKVADK